MVEKLYTGNEIGEILHDDGVEMAKTEEGWGK